MSTAAVIAPAPSAVRIVLTNRMARSATIAMVFTGLGFSMAAPQIVSFLVLELHASLTTAGLYYLTTLTAPIAGYLVGRRSDRTGKRMGIFRICALAGAVGWSVIAISTQVWEPFVISALVLGFGGGAGSQVYAALGDEMRRHPSPNADGVFAIVRGAMTAGWVVGPVIGAVVASAIGFRWMLALTALCAVAQIVPFGLRRSDPPLSASGDPIADGAAEVRAGGIRILLPLLAFTGLSVLVYSGDSIKFGFLPLYMREDLHMPASLRGFVIGIQPLIELAMMPLAILVARRIGRMRMLAGIAGFAVIANVLYATSTGVAGLLAGQVVMSVVWGASAAVGIFVAQSLLPDARATATAVYGSAVSVGQAVGGLTGGIGVAALGLPGVFFVPAALGLVALAGMVVLERRHRDL